MEVLNIKNTFDRTAIGKENFFFPLDSQKLDSLLEFNAAGAEEIRALVRSGAITILSGGYEGWTGQHLIKYIRFRKNADYLNPR